jgi:glucokinase
MNFSKDKRIVLTLDAGGTNFEFSAMQSGEMKVKPIRLAAEANDLGKCLKTIINGFSKVKQQLQTPPVAISFAFPGPADYPKGIIGDLGNLPAFKGGVPLGPMLSEEFEIPVFINNDGNLFVLGEAMAGLLPEINSLLAKHGSTRRYQNLFGVTLGTGFGGGIVLNNRMLIGDNSSAGEIWLMRHKLAKDLNAEEGVSIRAVKGYYARHAGINTASSPEPKEIYAIASGMIPGNRKAAQRAFCQLGELAGDAIANAITLIDGLVVIGGGLSGASSLFMPAIIGELNGNIGKVPRLEVKAFNLDDKDQLQSFLAGREKEIAVPGSKKAIKYDPLQRIGVATSRLGTEKATALGAYGFALNQLDSTD